MTDEKINAYDHGYTAGLTGLMPENIFDKTDNPKDYKDWDDGYNDGCIKKPHRKLRKKIATEERQKDKFTIKTGVFFPFSEHDVVKIPIKAKDDDYKEIEVLANMLSATFPNETIRLTSIATRLLEIALRNRKEP